MIFLPRIVLLNYSRYHFRVKFFKPDHVIGSAGVIAQSIHSFFKEKNYLVLNVGPWIHFSFFRKFLNFFCFEYYIHQGLDHDNFINSKFNLCILTTSYKIYSNSRLYSLKKNKPIFSYVFSDSSLLSQVKGINNSNVSLLLGGNLTINTYPKNLRNKIRLISYPSTYSIFFDIKKSSLRAKADFGNKIVFIVMNNVIHNTKILVCTQSLVVT